MVESKSGVLLLNKHAGISSNSLVNKVKYLVKAKKAGHLGTLDVLAEGVLPITLNKATRLFDYFLTKDKTYRAIFAFGIETSTFDCEGEITNLDYPLIDEDKIIKILDKFKGKIQQTPPQFSAIKINGKPAYKEARKGQVVELASREIQIFDLKLLEAVDQEKKKKLINRFFEYHNIDLLKDERIENALNKNVFEFEITCSSGTYIRALCRDIAKELSTCGTMLNIIRTRCGVFELKDTSSLEDVKNDKFKIIDVEKVIDLTSININEINAKDLLDGKKVKCFPIEKNSFKLYGNNEFLGIANNKNDGILKIEYFLKD